MSTLNELIYDLRGILKHGTPSKDDNISNEQIAFWIRNVRATLIRQEANKGYNTSSVSQSLECIPLTLVDASDCCGLDLQCGLLSTQDIPIPITGQSGDLLFTVSTSNLKGVPISFIPFERVPYWGNNRFSQDRPAAFKYENKIYLISQYNPGTINIQGVFENPEEASNFSNCSGESCFTWDSQYPIGEHMIDTMKKMILDTNFKVLMSTQQDVVNNNLDDPNQRN